MISGWLSDPDAEVSGCGCIFGLALPHRCLSEVPGAEFLLNNSMEINMVGWFRRWSTIALFTLFALLALFNLFANSGRC